MRLAPFIRANIEAILKDWETFARSIYPARHMNQRALRDHARNMLLVIADDLDQPQTKKAQKQKSRGRQKTNITAATGHGFHRHSSGFSITETISEFRALRASVIAQWKRRPSSVTESLLDDLIRFNEAIDEAVSDSVSSYALEKERHTKLFDTILGASPDAIFVLDAECRVLYANPAMERLAGLREQEMVGEDACNSVLPFDAEMIQKIAWVVDNRQGHHGELAHHESREYGLFEWCLIPVKGNDHEVENTVGILHDITARKIAEEEIWHSANYDLLTELPNRRLFFDRLEQGVEHCSRTGVPLAVMFIDLDGFKEINDRFGHEAGDQVLRGVADRLDSCIRKVDTAARLGGDEFAVIITDVQEDQAINKVADKIAKSLDSPFELENHPAQVSASIGIAFCPYDASDPEELLKKADYAMYRAKTSRQQHICFFGATSPGSTLH